MSYCPSPEYLTARHWFARQAVTTTETHAHVPFPVVKTEAGELCLCRDCTPAIDAEHEEKIQVAYVKAIEAFLSLHGFDIIT